jgi:hypothetical protein
MLILGISGRKQSGKTTTGNFILSLYLSKLQFSDKIYIDDDGQPVVSDILGNSAYSGVFDFNNLPQDDDTRYLVSKLNSQIKIYNFADILKTDICINILGLTKEQCYGSDDQKNELTDMFWEGKQLSCRDVMQVVGTDIFRKLDPNVWVRSTISKIMKESPELAIVTDCRFPNEIEAIKNVGGKVLRLTRNPFNSDHLSECVLDKDKYDWSNFDFIIDNDKMPLYDQLVETKKLLEQILDI